MAISTGKKKGPKHDHDHEQHHLHTGVAHSEVLRLQKDEIDKLAQLPDQGPQLAKDGVHQLKGMMPKLWDGPPKPDEEFDDLKAGLGKLDQGLMEIEKLLPDNRGEIHAKSDLFQVKIGIVRIDELLRAMDKERTSPEEGRELLKEEWGGVDTKLTHLNGEVKKLKELAEQQQKQQKQG